DGIRDATVTGVQTCALPILITPVGSDCSCVTSTTALRKLGSVSPPRATRKIEFAGLSAAKAGAQKPRRRISAKTDRVTAVLAKRSEERRVGSEGDVGWLGGV